MIEKFSLLKNRSSGNLFNNISNNNIVNSNNNIDNIYNSVNNSKANINNKINYSHYSKYQSLALNNSDITATTSINISRKPSNVETIREFNFHRNISSSLSRQPKSKKIRLSQETHQV